MRSNRKVLLVYPRVGADARKVSLHPPLSLLYLAAALPDYDVTLYDERTEAPERLDELLDQDPLCVGFSIFTGPQIRFALNLAQQVKDRGMPTVFGGIHPTILPEQTQQDPRVDYVVVGDGEFAFRVLLEALERDKPIDPIVTGEDLGTPDLDELPPLPYERLDVEAYVHTAALEGRSLPFLFSRGCPYECTFCCNPAISKGRWRTMSVDVAMRHIDALLDAYRLDGIFFQDENLLVNPKVLNDMAGRINGRFDWAAQVRADALLKYDLGFLDEMGARRFGIGLESGSPKILEQIKKRETVDDFLEANRRLARTDIRAWYNYITGFPDETLDDVRATIDLSLRILDDNPRADNNTFYLLTPYPGTEIGETLKDEMPDRLEGWSEFSRHNYNAKWHAPERMTLYKRIGFSSKFTGRRLLRLFPDDAEVVELTRIMTDKWRGFDFFDDQAWQDLTDRGWQTLKRLFGEHAY